MNDRVPGAPGQYKAIITPAEQQKMQAGEPFVITMTRDDHPITEGTPYSKAAVLPDDLAAALCPDIPDPTPADALRALQQHTASGSNPHTVTAAQVGAVNKNGDTMTGSLNINGSWKGVGFGENAAILNAGTRLTFDQRPQNSTGSYERYRLPTPTERTADAWYDIITAKSARVLWKNASPASDFNAQTITVSGLSNCLCIAVVLNRTDGDSFVIIIHKDVATTLATTAASARYDANTVYVSSRSVTPNFSDGTIYFGKGYQNSTENNARAIPVAVIGLY